MDCKIDIIQPSAQRVVEIISLVQKLEQESNFLKFGPEFKSSNQANLVAILKMLPFNRRNLLLVAQVKQQFVGIITLNLTAETNLSAELGIGVLQIFQNQQIGSMLIDEAIQWFENYSKLNSIWLEVYQANLKAIHLYRKYGFKTVSLGKNTIKMIKKATSKCD